jgi:N-acetylglucosamine-6-phosphate deacetylase
VLRQHGTTPSCTLQAALFWDRQARDVHWRHLVVDCQGLLVAPGLVDLQLNGAFGVDFSSPSLTADEVQFVRRQMLQFGVTAFCPTMVSCARERYVRNLPLLASHDSLAPSDGASLLGVHLEGPFFSMEKRGAHKPAHILPPAATSDPFSPAQAMQHAYGLDGDAGIEKHGIAVVTLAPELPGSLELTAWLTSQGVRVSMGHTEATVRQGKAAVAAGATMITHLFNAMTAFHHRDPGLVGLLAQETASGMAASASSETPSKRPKLVKADQLCDLDQDAEGCLTVSHAEQSIMSAPSHQVPRVWFSLICDGIHAHRHSVSLARSTHPRGLVLITDGISSLGLPPGKHPLGDNLVSLEYTETESLPSPTLVARLAECSTLAGAVSPLDACVRRFREFTGCSRAEAIAAASERPCSVLGDATRGCLHTPATRADLVFLDASTLSPVQTWVAGQLGWSSARGLVE